MTALIPRLNRLRKDDALLRTGTYYLMFLCLGLGMGATGPTLPALAHQTGGTLGTISWIFLAGSIGYTAGTALGGRIFDRRGGHPALALAQLSAGALVAILPLVPRLWMLVLLVAGRGLAQGTINTGVNTLLVWTHRERTAPFMNGLHFTFGLGAFLSPLLAAQVIGFEGGYRWVYWALAACEILVGLLVLSLRSAPAALVQPQADGGPKPGSRIPYPLVAVSMLFLFFYVGSEITFGNWIYTYALTLGLASAAWAAYLNSGFWLSFTVGRLLSIPLAVRLAPHRVLPAALLGSLAAVALLLAFPGTTGMLWATVIGLGFFLAPIWPNGFTLAGQSLHLTARLSSLILLGDSLGGMLLPWLVGQVIEASGPLVMTRLVFASLVLTLLAFIGMLRLRPKTSA